MELLHHGEKKKTVLVVGSVLALVQLGSRPALGGNPGVKRMIVAVPVLGKRQRKPSEIKVTGNLTVFGITDAFK